MFRSRASGPSTCVAKRVDCASWSRSSEMRTARSQEPSFDKLAQGVPGWVGLVDRERLDCAYRGTSRTQTG